MKKVVFRRATVADVPSLVALRAAFLAEVAGSDPKAPSLLKALTRYFSAGLSSGEFVAYLATVGGQVVATSGMVYHHHPPRAANLNGSEAYVMNMYTLPPWRQQGIARALLKKLIIVARKNHCAQINLHAHPKAKPVYLRAGFVTRSDDMYLKLKG
jgi:GNAT superfamily N-acetyltransferase